MSRVRLAGKLLQIERNWTLPMSGALVASLNDQIYAGRMPVLSIFGLLRQLFMHLFRGVFYPPCRFPSLDGRLLVSKVADTQHYRALTDPIKQYYSDKAVLWSPCHNNEIKPYLFFRAASPGIWFTCLLSVLSSAPRVYRIYRDAGIVVSFQVVAGILMEQMVAMEAWMQIFRHQQPALVVVDFDRNNKNIPLVLAARKFGIRCVTLVHGVMNPPYGYWPVYSDEIWCWSNMQSDILVNQGVPAYKISVVGSPAAVKYQTRTGSRFPAVTIGVALNMKSDSENEWLMNYLLEHDASVRFKWLVKLHPSMKRQNWMDTHAHAEYLESSDNAAFFSEIDLLIAGNSGLSAEAILNDVPVWIFKSDPDSQANDAIMTSSAGCPDISNKVTLTEHLLKLGTEPDYLKSLLGPQKLFIVNFFYAKTGPEATRNIISNINLLLDKA